MEKIYQNNNNNNNSPNQTRNISGRLFVTTSFCNIDDSSNNHLRSLKQGYSLDKKSKINHSLYMDDLKLYGKSNHEIDTLIQTVGICTTDIDMKFGLDKCGVLAMKRGKVTACEGIMLNNEEVIGDVSAEGYKYLGIIERGDIAHEEMKQKTRKEYMDRVRKVMKSKLNGGNVIKAINTWAIPLIRYGAGIIDLDQE